MSYYDEIDPIGEDMNDGECLYCSIPCQGMYCSTDCKNADLD